MKQVDITDLTNLYASFMRIKKNPEQKDVQVLGLTTNMPRGNGGA